MKRTRYKPRLAKGVAPVVKDGSVGHPARLLAASRASEAATVRKRVGEFQSEFGWALSLSTFCPEAALYFADADQTRAIFRLEALWPALASATLSTGVGRAILAGWRNIVKKLFNRVEEFRATFAPSQKSGRKCACCSGTAAM